MMKAPAVTLMRMLGVAVLSFMLALSSAAADTVSRYSDVGGSACKPRKDGFDRCPGFAGFAVILSDNGNINQLALAIDGREDVVFQAQNLSSRMEWRGSARAGAFHPQAAILRMDFMTDGDAIGQVLALAKVDRAASCLIGYIDARTPKANERARDLAQRQASSFRCGVDAPQLFGTASPALVEKLSYLRRSPDL